MRREHDRRRAPPRNSPLVDKMGTWRVPGLPLLLVYLPLLPSSLFLATMVMTTAGDDGSVAGAAPAAVVLGIAGGLLPGAGAFAVLTLAAAAAGLRFRPFTILERLVHAGRCRTLWSPVGEWLCDAQSTADKMMNSGGRRLDAKASDGFGWRSGTEVNGDRGSMHAQLARAFAPWFSWSRVWWAGAIELGCVIVVAIALGATARLGCLAVAAIGLGVAVLRLAFWIILRPHSIPAMNLAMCAGALLLVAAFAVAMAHAAQTSEPAAWAGQALALASFLIPMCASVVLVAARLCFPATNASSNAAAFGGPTPSMFVASHGGPLLVQPTRYDDMIDDDSSISDDEAQHDHVSRHDRRPFFAADGEQDTTSGASVDTSVERVNDPTYGRETSSRARCVRVPLNPLLRSEDSVWSRIFSDSSSDEREPRPHR